MIRGVIDEHYEARVVLQIQHGSEIRSISFLIDTGFNGYLALPMSVVSEMGIPLVNVQVGKTADGRMDYVDTVDVRVQWDGRFQLVRAQVLEEPMIGTRLLRGHFIRTFWEAGAVFVISSADEKPNPVFDIR